MASVSNIRSCARTFGATAVVTVVAIVFSPKLPAFTYSLTDLEKSESHTKANELTVQIDDPSPEAALQQAISLSRTGKYSEAFQIFTRISPQVPHARALMGVFYERGLSVEKDQSRAVWWYQQAAKDGDADGLFFLAQHLSAGVGVSKDAGQARATYKLCADAGDARCQNNLGQILRHGVGGPADKQMAVVYFRLAAAHDQINAITSLADCYENGDGVPVDIHTAVALYTVAAKRNFHIANLSLGNLYERGLGVPRNDVYAAMHYILATQRQQGIDESYYRQEYDKANASLSRILTSLSSEQAARSRLLAAEWPNVPTPSTEIAGNATVDNSTSPSKLTNSAIMSRLSAATALIVGRSKDGLVIGSGFWVTPTVLITNRHVVEGTETGLVIMMAGSTTPLVGTVLAISGTSNTGDADIATISVPLATNVTTLPFTSSVIPLTDVVASGFPGFSVTNNATFWDRVRSNDFTAPSNILTTGQVSSVEKPNGQAEIIMHTAQIYHGDSGGPLIDRCGRAVGMNTYTYANTNTQEKTNYAIASATIMEFLRNNSIPFNSSPGDCS